MSQQDSEWFSQWFNALLDNVGRVIKGKPDEIGFALVGLFAEGHLLLEDYPGTGKTTLAKSMASSIRGTWNRVQFTPDLLPTDVTGGLVYNQSQSAFEFHAGPIFSNIVLADEINRASPKTQSALLQVMEEGQVSIDVTTHDVPSPFMVIATQNPIEQEGTYRLPEAQLDRFLMKLSIGYPGHDAEVDVLRSVGSGMRASDLQPILGIDDVREMIAYVRTIHLEDSIRSYIVRLCAATRAMPELRLGVSTRGAIGLMNAGRAMAASQGRTYVNVDDIKTLAPAIMGHRMLLTPEAELKNVKTMDLVGRVLDATDAPAPVRA